MGKGGRPVERARRQLRQRRYNRIAAAGYSGSSGRCGDSYGWAKLADGRLAAALSDGTGKGEAAARESSRAVNAVLGLLRAGTDPELSLQILNLILTMDNRKEQFPTMDLALLDPESRELRIYKIGAAPTVIVRTPRCRPKLNGQMPAGPFPPESFEILTVPAMPMGVSAYSEIPCISTLVMPGDLIIMMTDGVADSRRSACEFSAEEDGCPMDDYPELVWLRRLLAGIRSRNPQTICDLIIRGAALNYGGREKDDMSVVVMRV